MSGKSKESDLAAFSNDSRASSIIPSSFRITLCLTNLPRASSSHTMLERTS